MANQSKPSKAENLVTPPEATNPGEPSAVPFDVPVDVVTANARLIAASLIASAVISKYGTGRKDKDVVMDIVKYMKCIEDAQITTS